MLRGVHETTCPDEASPRRVPGAAKPPLADKPKEPARWETAIDPVNQVAVIRAHFADRTTQDTRIPRSEIGAITEFLEHAAKRFDAGAEMRQ